MIRVALFPVGTQLYTYTKAGPVDPGARQFARETRSVKRSIESGSNVIPMVRRKRL